MKIGSSVLILIIALFVPQVAMANETSSAPDSSAILKQAQHDGVFQRLPSAQRAAAEESLLSAARGDQESHIEIWSWTFGRKPGKLSEGCSGNPREVEG